MRETGGKSELVSGIALSVLSCFEPTLPWHGVFYWSTLTDWWRTEGPWYDTRSAGTATGRAAVRLGTKPGGQPDMHRQTISSNKVPQTR